MAPRQLPRFATSQSQKRGLRLWGSGDLIADPEFDKSVLFPFAANGTPTLEAAKNILVSAGKDGACM